MGNSLSVAKQLSYSMKTGKCSVISIVKTPVLKLLRLLRKMFSIKVLEEEPMRVNLDIVGNCILDCISL